MTTRANANALFQGTPPTNNLVSAISISQGDPEHKVLSEARTLIRNTLRPAFKKYQNYVINRGLLLENRGLPYERAQRELPELEIKFLTQGSFAYKTLIRPQHHTQQIDLDDGIYVKMPFIEGVPVIASKALFEVMETALTPMVKAQGWKFKQKDTCLRIILAEKHNAHIDLPLYAIETSEFARLEKVLANSLGETFDSADYGQYSHFRRFQNVSDSKILLAHRQLDWEASDPKKIHDWFDAYIERYGECLRRMCKYAKAWRDKHWSVGGPSSLSLMAICAQTLDQLQQQPANNRDDLLMLHVAENMVSAFGLPIVNPNGGKSLNSKWTTMEQQEYIRKAQELRDLLDRSLNSTPSPELIAQRLRDAFGTYVPPRHDLIKMLDAAQVAAAIQVTAKSVAMPVVGKSVSA